MNNLIDSAQRFLNCDISVVPVKKDKRPPIKWTNFQQTPMSADDVPALFSGAYGIGIIGGAVSDGLEIIDFDAHGNSIDQLFDSFKSDSRIAEIFKRHNIYIEKSPNGGIHLVYTYETDGRRDGSQKLASWTNGESMIETRGEGGYCIVSPTPGYTTVSGSIEELPRLIKEERDYLIEFSKTFSQVDSPKDAETPKDESFDRTDPVSYFNWYKSAYARKLLTDDGWRKLRYDDKLRIEYWLRPGKDDDSSHSATWGYKDNSLYVFSSSAAPFREKCYYTPFQILVLIRFNGNYRSAFEWVLSKFFNEDVTYMRIGVDYFKKIRKLDRYNIERTELKRWVKDEIKQDHGKTYLDKIPRFDDFTIRPNNLSYEPVVKNCYNLYREFPHSPARGSWKWTKVLLEHIFGEQYDLGLRYLQILYLHPDRLMPILVLVSRERQTGKTTFINWLNMIFGDNMANINPEDLINGFNFSYAASNIIAIEETMVEKNVTVEKLKSLATTKFISVNQKFVSQYRMPFFGKIILTSNMEDKFARIDQEEIRFFIRKVHAPKIENHNIENDMLSEISAFLHHLTTLPPVNFSTDRTGFTPEELDNESLRLIKHESTPETEKELNMFFEELFLNELKNEDQFYVDAINIKQKYYSKDPRSGTQWILRILKTNMKIQPTDQPIYFKPFGTEPGKTARAFLIKRERFTNIPKDEIPF